MITLEEIIDQAKGQIAAIATQQVEISQEIAKIRPELESLKAQKSDLEKAVEQMKAEIAAKNNAIEAEINQRSNQVALDEQKNSQEAQRLEVLKSELEEKEKAVAMRIEEARINEAANHTAKSENDAFLAELKEREADLQKRLNEIEAKSVSLDEVIKNANQEIANHRAKGEALDKEIEKNVAFERQLLDEKTELTILTGKFNEQFKKLKEWEDRLDQEDKAVKEKLAKAEENDQRYAAQLKTLDDKASQVKLLMLEVKDQIRKNKIQMDIEDLEK